MRSCRRTARWRPVLYVPVLDGVPRVLRLPLPVVVCALHKLPRYDWTGLEDPRLATVIENETLAAPQMRKAWIVHTLVATALAGGES
jgi:hypothetical protein